MKRPAPRRSAVAVAATTLAMFSLGVTTAVLVAGAASAALPPTSTTTTTATTTAATRTTTDDSPAGDYLVVNGTANATSVHVIGGSSAFPNFKTGAIDNSYSLAHAHVDNSPFAQGTGSPADTGPVGQTVAAGHFQQPQYADARWPGDPDKATYGKEGEPYATASASAYRATAEASLASRGSSGPSGPGGLVVPNGLDDRLEQALAAWSAVWEGRLAPKRLGTTLPTPKLPTLTTPTVTTTKLPVPVPSSPVPSPAPPPPAPPQALPPPTVPSLPGGSQSSPSRSLAAAPAPRDGVFLLESSALATFTLKPGAAKTAKRGSGTAKTGTLVTSGESRLGRLSLGGGRIVIEDVHVSASITNDGSPTHKVAVTVGSATIGGVPVTIDEDGVHLAAQRQGLPYEQAGNALNAALKQAGIQLFLVAPEITTNECDETETGNDSGTTTTQSDSDQPGTDTGAGSCDEGDGATDACAPTGSGTGTTTTGTTTTTTTAPTAPPIGPSETTEQSETTTAPNSCEGFAPPPSTSSCPPAGAGGTGTTTTSSGPATPSTGTTSFGGSSGGESGGLTVKATGLRVVFTQPARQAGVPAQHAEYVLGEVFLDSLAVPLGPLPELDLSSSPSSASSPSSSSCPGGGLSSGATSGGASTGGAGVGSGGFTSSGSLAPAGSAFGSATQPVSGSTGASLPARVAAALTKPLWLLLAYLLWQAIAVGTGVSLWNWRRGEAS